MSNPGWRGTSLLAFVLLASTASALVRGGARLGRAGETADAGGAQIGRLLVHVPDADRFVLHGTLPLSARPFRRFPCPFVVRDPDGIVLPTQWELVAQLEEQIIVEILAVVENRWSGVQTFTVHPGTSRFDPSGFDRAALAAITTAGAIGLEFTDQGGATLDVSLSAPLASFELTRLGSATLTFHRRLQTPFGGLQVWMSLRAARSEVELVLNWHNGGLPASPDVHLRSLTLKAPAGVRWSPLLPDPAVSFPFLVRPGNHVLPQRMERPFRIVLYPEGVTPDLSLRGWGIGNWVRNGGYLPQALHLPSLDGLVVDLTADKNAAFFRLENNLPTQPGSQPVSVLFPAAGVFYGGMTGGIDIEQIPFVPLAVTGQPDGLLRAYVEQLRYATRPSGCIYGTDGSPIALDDHLSADGTTPWNLFDNRFLVIAGAVQDEPFGFSRTGPGPGRADYDPWDFAPIDTQHLVRRTKANKALVWLDNDPLARQYLRMDAELARMSYYEGPGGRLVVPDVPGEGAALGRAHAWAADVMAAAHATSDEAWRARSRPWFETFVAALATAQMQSGLFSAQSTGKAAELPPYGDGNTAWYWVHRSNEQVFLMLALRAIDRTVGLDCGELIRRAGEGLWNYAWKPGENGPLVRYPAGPIGAPRWATRDEFTLGLTVSEPADAYHVGTALALAQMEGANMLPALLAYSGEQDARDALAALESWGLTNLANRANTIALLQGLLP